MEDVSQGQERVRAWPRKRGRAKTTAERKRQDKFTAAQFAIKYMAPQIAVAFREACKNTPLMPRDLLTSMLYGRLAMFVMEDGRKLWPITAQKDVEEALDTITQTPGDTIRRSADGWQGVPYGGGGGGGQFQLLDVNGVPTNAAATWAYSAAIPYVDVFNLGEYSDLMIIARNVTTSASATRLVRVSVDNGVTFFDQSADYCQLSATGTETASTALMSHGTASALARTIAGIVHGSNARGASKLCFNPTIANTGRLFIGSDQPITALRFGLDNSANLTGGSLLVYGRS